MKHQVWYRTVQMIWTAESSGRNPIMNRFLMLGAAAALLIGSTGCLHHHTRGGLSNCEPAACEPAGCEPGDGCEPCGANARSNALLGKVKNVVCNSCGRPGCVAGKLGWQRGGHNYSSNLNSGCKNCPPAGGQAGIHPGMHPGMQSATMAYPYYTIRSPRDFLVDNPPSIGY